jgi:hypothetical protein
MNRCRAKRNGGNHVFKGSRFRVQGFRVQGSRVQRLKGLGFRVQGSKVERFRVQRFKGSAKNSRSNLTLGLPYPS